MQPAPATAVAQSEQTVDIIDQQGFDQAITAATARVPTGWQTAGGVNWNRQTHCVGNQMRLEWVASSPDGQQALEILHGFSWQIQGTQIQMNPCPAAPFNSTQSFLAAVVQQRRPGAHIVEYRDRPDLSQAARAATAQAPGGARMHFDAGQMLIAYEIQGRPVRELFSASLSFSEMQGNVVGGTSMVFAQRAPEGQLDPKVGDRITASIKANPQWVAMMQSATRNAEQRFSSNQRQEIDRWHASEMARINAQGAADRAAIRSRTNAEVAQIYANTNANTQATNDNIHRRNLEAVGEYNTYRDANGNTVRASIHGGQRVIRNPDGTYTTTNNPYATPPAGAEELKRVR
ncbi:hypothetical protein J7U46_12285 [Pelomonas sp. V22]|uniref:hypothetical protein n=1 Tax=Pelomonas sp. V22 TaxID=2822139 RepID=UPI0024A90CB6|nr:hypothetical protein [Pelomonas sp. V22]MDI4633829.1 hypothetical protein [Pelomonas sp. V22]